MNNPPEYCPKCLRPRTNEGQPSARWFFTCGSYGYAKDEGFQLTDRTDLCYEREENATLRAEVERLQEVAVNGAGAACLAELRAENERLQMQVDGMVDAEVVRQLRAENERLRSALTEKIMEADTMRQHHKNAEAEADRLRQENKIMTRALQQFAECKLSDENCASLEVANRRIRNIARQALAATRPQS